jgi:hypothetical protein
MKKPFYCGSHRRALATRLGGPTRRGKNVGDLLRVIAMCALDLRELAYCDRTKKCRKSSSEGKKPAKRLRPVVDADRLAGGRYSRRIVSDLQVMLCRLSLNYLELETRIQKHERIKRPRTLLTMESVQSRPRVSHSSYVRGEDSSCMQYVKAN